MVADFSPRRAPYAPVAGLREFLERIRSIGVPTRVDKHFLQKHSIAGGNEWALLSALKFLGVIDEQGVPSTAYRSLQSSELFVETLRRLVLDAYKPLVDDGGLEKSVEDLRNYFRFTSSPSQAKNAARFFREVCDMAQVASGSDNPPAGGNSSRAHLAVLHSELESEASGQPDPAEVFRAKKQLLDRFPEVRPDWSAQDYQGICDHFLALLKQLDPIR